MSSKTTCFPMNKRIFDIVFSLLVLIGSLPVLIVLAFLVKLSSKGPILYGSPRVGHHGNMFFCWKFRSMRQDAPLLLRKILAENPLLQLEWQKNYKLQEDCRVTALGRFLRKTSLDELPQFWNVLLGELSVVGPRPVSVEEAALFRSRWGEEFFSIKPGITGLWQVSRTAKMTYEERVELEGQYIHTKSFYRDLRLIIKTIPLIFFPKRTSSL
ncbi:MAG: sugar transferase [Chlamydiae bacterium]|nr:sugar transferase [Chlamydiota bacterium]